MSNNRQEKVQQGYLIENATLQLASQLRRRYLVQALINSLPLVSIIFIFIYEQSSALFSELSYAYSTTLSVLFLSLWLMFLVVILLARMSQKYKNITPKNLLFHLNRQFPDLEESAQLVLINTENLNALQQLQKQRISKRLIPILHDKSLRILPSIRIRNGAVGLVIVLLLWFMISTAFRYFSEQSEPSLLPKHGEIAESVISIDKAMVTVTPPIYSELEAEHTSALDLNLLADSEVNWQFEFSHTQQAYSLIFGNGDEVSLTKQKDGRYIAQAKIAKTGVYQIVSQDRAFVSVHTLNVSADKKPTIRFISPKKNIVELAKDADAIIETTVQITDDFRLSKVEILASVAKGSGESVKFRDHTFEFDKSYHGANHDVFSKTWDLIELGMEPGDELYFTVNAWDNREPKPQFTRSVTKVIRWLEEGQAGILSEGILIDFMPEYFKSQRQIIIETIELIEDKEQLSSEKFVETSELLGVAQSSLKEKYGQYLGDEFESGEHAFSGEADSHNHGEGNNENHQDHQHNRDEAKAHENEQDENGHHEEEASSESYSPLIGNDHAHEHGAGGGSSEVNFEMQTLSVDRSGKSEQIARFGHNHGDADIGLMAKQDPKALMKRSISNMWQAELHLMLSQPQKALPYEEEALKYLKLAKKADRIYVKRLGFEPPPVTEERRYLGELDEILSYQRNHNTKALDQDNLALGELYRLLEQAKRLVYSDINSKVMKNKLTTEDTLTFNREHENNLQTVKEFMQERLSTRPSLIKHLATVEKMLIEKRFDIAGCDGCIIDLQEKVWQLMEPQLAQPFIQEKYFSDKNELLLNYGKFLEEKK